MSHNPFEAPASMEQFSSGAFAGDLPLASQGQRFANFLVDAVVVHIAAAAAGVILGVAAIALNAGRLILAPVSVRPVARLRKRRYRRHRP